MEYQIADRIATVKGSIIRELFKVVAKNPGTISFAGGNPDPATFPTKEIAEISNRILTEDPYSVLQYGASEGYIPLREEVKKYLKRKENIDFENNELFIVSGGQQCTDLTAKIFCNEGANVCVEAPSFVGCLNTFRSYGCNLIGVPMQEDGVDVEKLEEAFKNQKISLFYTIPTFQNPSGYTMSLEKRKKVYELACKYNVMILEDNPYGELRYAGEYVPTIKSMDTENRVIYAGSFSKVIAPSFRLGILVFPKELTSRYTVAKQVTDVQSTVLFQRITYEYMTQYDYDAHIKSNCEIYGRKSNLMLGEMEKQFDERVRFIRPEGGLFVMAFLPEGYDSTPFVTELLNRKVAAVPGNAFEVDTTIPVNGIRLNYATPSEEEIVKGIKIMGDLTKEWIK